MVRRRGWLNGLGPGVGLVVAWLWTGGGDYGGYDAVPGGQLLNQHVVQGRLTLLHFFPLVVVVPFCRYLGRLRGADGAKRAKRSAFLAPKFPLHQMVALRLLSTVIETLL